MKNRLDQELVKRSFVPTRSQAEIFIKLGQVKVNDQVVNKPAFLVSELDEVKLISKEQYVSRAGLKLASVARKFQLDFKGKIVLDVGSSTGGFTDYALQHGAAKVVAVDVGSKQMNPILVADKRVELHEQTDIRDFKSNEKIDLVLVDVSFISTRLILAHLKTLTSSNSLLIVMVKPQFETQETSQKNRGVIKNEQMRRQILKDWEIWVQKIYKILDKADSNVAGEKGNVERFYKLKPL